WDVETGQELRCFKGHTLWVASVALSPDGRRVLSGSGDGTVRLGGAETGEGRRRIEEHTRAVTSVACTPDGKRALSGSEDGTLRCFTLSDGKEVHCFRQGGPVLSVAASPDGLQALSGASDSTIRLWRVPR